ncbi:hypothetical protein BD779DRAFT_1801236 [Infundibulicybe gibba]|nr:hypothetical protein BD779DRAFT_1801236 [Infundibulicybe gibba]
MTAGEHPGVYEAGKDIVRPNAPIPPTHSPFPGMYEADKDTPRVGSPYPYPFSHVRRPQISAPPELAEPPSLLEAELEARREAEAEHPLTRDARRTVKTPEVELEAGHEAEHPVREVESNMREVAGQEAAHGGVTCIAEREFTMEDHAPIDPSPLTQGTMIGDATSPPVDEYIPPVSSPSTAAGSEAFTNKPGDLPQPMMVVNPARSSPAISNLEPPVTVPVTAPPMPVPDNTNETHPLLRRPSLSEHVSYLPPPAYPNHNISLSDGISMDCGMMPSYLYSPNQRSSRHRIPSPQEPEQGKVSDGESRTRVEWVVPFSYDSHPSNAYQQNPGECPDRVHSVIHDFETRGASPHISPPSPSSSSSGYGSHLHSPANPHHAIPSSTKPPPQEDRLFNAHGWVEYLLPDERLYYVHQCYQVVIDMDLNDERLLDAVMAYLEDHCDAIPPGRELWLRDTGFHEGKFVPLRWLVDHSKQLVAFNPLHKANNGGSECHRPQYGCEDDRLDAKYRYWSFMESHPAHTSLPLDAHQKAMEVLSWASTSELLPPNHSTPAPFTQEECQRLTALLQLISKQGETPLRTNTVSKILLRAICRHQSHFRPDKPLPVDAGRDGLRREGHSTPARSSKFMLTVGVHACLAAVVALYPSKTFVKVAGIGALLFSLSSVVSNVVTTAEFKAVAFHVRRAMLMFSLKDRTVADSRPPQNGWVSDRWDRGRTWRPLASMRLVNQLRLLAVVLKFKLSRWLHRVPFIYWLLRLRGAEMTTVDC